MRILKAVLLAVAVFVGMHGAAAGVAGAASGGDLECAAFGTREAAADTYRSQLALTGRDVYRLDGDGDGAPCETLPSAGWYGVFGAVVGAVIAGWPLAKAGTKPQWGVIAASGFVGILAATALTLLGPSVLPIGTSPFMYALLAGAVGAGVQFYRNPKSPVAATNAM
jgi:peptidoglycan/LPS O-acetylase OafA/YrhL